MRHALRWVRRYALSPLGAVMVAGLASDTDVASGGRMFAAPEQQAALTVRVRVDVQAGFDVSCHGPFADSNPGTLDESHRAHDVLTVEYQGSKRFPLRRLIDRVDIDEANDAVDVRVTSSVSGGGSRYHHWAYTSNSGLGTTTRDEATNWRYAAGEGEAPAPSFTYKDDDTIDIEPWLVPSVVTTAETARYAEVAPKRRIVNNDPDGRGMGVASGVMETAFARAREDERFVRQLTAKLPSNGAIGLSGRATFTFADRVAADAPRGDTGWNGGVGAGCVTPARGSASYQATIQVDWTLGAAPPPAEIVVTPPANLSTWRPMAARPGTPGTVLTFRGRVQAIDGQPVQSDSPVVVELELLASQQPGDCSNHPENPGKSIVDPDLDTLQGGTSPELEVVSRESIEEGDYRHRTRLRGMFKVGDRFTLAVGSFDYGAFGELRVSGSVPARVERQPGTTVLLPKDGNRNHVPDWWEASNVRPGWSTSATADEDDVPEPGEDGDGLSVYEEYRGFYVDGRWLSTHAYERDFFVYSTRRASTDAGVDLFSAATGIRTHKIRADEMDPSKAINFNSVFGHAQNQRAVAIRVLNTEAQMNAACGVGQNDAMTRIGGCGGDREVILLRGTFSAETVEHELGHVVQVDHHGDGYYDLAPCDAAGSGSDICQRKLSARQKLAGAAAAMGLNLDRVVVAPQHDETSGVERCVMRYNWAHFIERDDGSFVPYGRPEPDGREFCTKSQGDGVNAPLNRPYPKTGNAMPGRGNCIERIGVRDTRK